MSDKGRLVYSTGVGAMCPDCGWPKDNCQCSKQFDQPVPLKIIAKLRMEKKGRGGKTVTVVDGLPRNAAFLKELSQELKRACGTGPGSRREPSRRPVVSHPRRTGAHCRHGSVETRSL